MRDRNNESRIKITATETSCSNTKIDIDFDTRNISQSVEQKLNEVVSTDEYVETPDYESATTELYDILQSNFGGESGTMKYEGACYNVSLDRVHDD